MPREYDDDDDQPRSVKKKPADRGVDMVIPFRNGMALGAYYCGVFGLISCFLFGIGGVFGIVPIILGILGLKRASQDAEARGRVHAWVGIGLGLLEVLTGCGTIGFFIFTALMAPR